jgi:hypothetical protein
MNMLHRLLITALACATLAAATIPDGAYAGGWRARHAGGWGRGAAVYPGWGYYSYPWGYVIPTAPYAYPVVENCLRRYPVPSPWGWAWRGTWAC